MEGRVKGRGGRVQGRGEEASVGGEGVEATVVLEAAFESCSPHPAPPLSPRTLRSSSHSIRLKAISSLHSWLITSAAAPHCFSCNLIQ